MLHSPIEANTCDGPLYQKLNLCKVIKALYTIFPWISKCKYTSLRMHLQSGGDALYACDLTCKINFPVPVFQQIVFGEQIVTQWLHTVFKRYWFVISALEGWNRFDRKFPDPFHPFHPGRASSWMPQWVPGPTKARTAVRDQDSTITPQVTRCFQSFLVWSKSGLEGS